MSLSELVSLASSGKVTSVEMRSGAGSSLAHLSNGESYVVRYDEGFAGELTSDLLKDGVALRSVPAPVSPWQTLFEVVLILVLGVLGTWVLSRLLRGSRFGRSQARDISSDPPAARFSDLAGAQDALLELEELKDFLRSPRRYRELGATPPRGVLLVGPPGTGKTLAARALAGEAGVPFFPLAASSFVEMYVGVGAARVRDLFRRARAAAPCIVFVDEIDAVGRRRSASASGGQEEREHTLDQLLVEMQGFDESQAVIVLAATNRPDVLDPALLRPGRFDRQVVFEKPDVRARREILAVHASRRRMAAQVDLGSLAKGTAGFTGAELANVVNEAALLAARAGALEVSQPYLQEAIDRTLAGAARRSRRLSLSERTVVAYHEAGHCLVAHWTPGVEAVQRVSITARTTSLGSTVLGDTQESAVRTKEQLEGHLAVILAGRCAEELLLGQPTSGAVDDLRRATELATAMVTEYGMCTAVGPRTLERSGGEIGSFLQATVDEEVRALLEQAHKRSSSVLSRRREVLDRVAQALVENETLDAAAIRRLAGPPVRLGPFLVPPQDPARSPRARHGLVVGTVGSVPSGDVALPDVV